MVSFKIVSLLALAFTSVSSVLPGVLVDAAYDGDIVGAWNQYATSAFFNLTPLPSGPHFARALAVVHEAILIAAKRSNQAGLSLEIQQLAISHAAHDSILAQFPNQGLMQDMHFKQVEASIGFSGSPQAKETARTIGEAAAAYAIKARIYANDGYARYTPYMFRPVAPGVYQATPPENMMPMAPSARYFAPFGGVKRSTLVWTTAPPAPTSSAFETALRQVFDKGRNVGSTRTAYETETAYYWLESPMFMWNRIARSVISPETKWKSNPLDSAQFWAKFTFSIANSQIVIWDTKFGYDYWRPITTIRYPSPFLTSGATDLHDPNWTPLASTPGHQEYLSGHATTAAAAAGIVRRYLGTDNLDPPVVLGTNVTMANVGYLEREWESIQDALQSTADSRTFIGAHFAFSSSEGLKAGEEVAKGLWAEWSTYFSRL